jgi:hypothetical protein
MSISAPKPRKSMPVTPTAVQASIICARDQSGQARVERVRFMTFWEVVSSMGAFVKGGEWP